LAAIFVDVIVRCVSVGFSKAAQVPYLIKMIDVKLCLAVLLLSAASPLSWAQKPELVLQIGHSGPVNSVAFSADGKFLASGSVDRTIKLWDVGSGRRVNSRQRWRPWRPVSSPCSACEETLG